MSRVDIFVDFLEMWSVGFFSALVFVLPFWFARHVCDVAGDASGEILR